MYIPGTLHIQIQNGSLVISNPILSSKDLNSSKLKQAFQRWVGFRVPGIRVHHKNLVIWEDQP